MPSPICWKMPSAVLAVAAAWSRPPMSLEPTMRSTPRTHREQRPYLFGQRAAVVGGRLSAAGATLGRQRI
ncbi:hypothetical protein ACFYYD_30315 [Streptomyces bluensis]